MRLSWQDVKKQVRRRAGELTVTLDFLRPGERRAEIARLLVYHEQLCGQSRQHFAQDEASTRVGDYRLANCLLPVLSTWYTWQQPTWEAQLRTLNPETRTALAEAAITSPVHVRLALFDYVNTQYAGFLTEQTRASALDAFAARYALTPEQLASLLTLDAEDEARLTRTCSAVPDAEVVATLYNQWVFEAALCNASEVRFVIDCAAFLAVQRSEHTENVTGLGTVIKRLCYLARTIGVYYDLSYENGEQALFLQLTLYGPQDMTGSPQQYGIRLARLCRVLLGYGIASAPTPTRRAGAVLSRALREAEATVYVFQQRCRFALNADLLALLPAPEQEPPPHQRAVAETTVVYDSSIEQSFAEAFASLERSQGTAGWQLEREPEPLLFTVSETGASGLFLPDFALTRGSRRIYVEILGFWTPAYRERKMYKLQHLRGQADLILALPQEAQPFFAVLAADYPLVVYRQQLSATDLLHVLQTRYDDFEERLAQLDSASVQARLRAARFIPERDCYALLHCYRRSELPRALAHVLAPDMGYTPGLGLYLHTWLDALHRTCLAWIEAQGQAELPLAMVMRACQADQMGGPELAACDESTIETLLNLWPEVHVQHASIFEAKLLVKTFQHTEVHEPATEQSIARSKKVGHERRASHKKPPQSESNQPNLWEV